MDENNSFEKQDIEQLKLLYTETGNMIRHAYSWREKVVVRFLISIGALCAAWAWLHINQKELIWIPITLGILGSILSALMDRSNANYFSRFYKLGQELEEKMQQQGVFTIINEYYTHRNWDVSTGLQTREALENLGLKDVAVDLEQRGLLMFCGDVGRP